MNTPSPHHRPQDSATFGLRRDEAILSLLDIHPVTAAMLVAPGWFPNRQKACRRLHVLLRRKHVTKVGTVWRKPGRPEDVYCGWLPKSDQLYHEVELTELCLRLSTGGIRRGPAITNQSIRADAEVWINGKLYYLELDRGTMRMEQIERRLARYEGCPHVSLWVCRDEHRREELRRRAKRVRGRALFTTFAEAIADPHGKIWLDFAGGTVALPRERAADRVAESDAQTQKQTEAPGA